MEDQLVVFRLGKETYAVPIAQVREIIHHTGATKLPSSPAHVEGIINIRGKIIPVISLAVLLDSYEAAAAAQRKIIVVDAKTRELGLVVDEVSEVLRISADAVEANPEGTQTAQRFVRGVGKIKNQLVIILDLDKMFTDQAA